MSSFLLLPPWYLDFAVAVATVITVLVLALLIYLIFVKPVLLIMADLTAQPPEPGYVYEITVDDTNRNRVISVGALNSDVKTRMKGIKEDHLRIRFKKEPGQEDYTITVIPGGAVFYRAPHAAKLEMLDSPDTFESSELIGHPAVFRLAASVSGGRAIQFIEMELSNYFTKDPYGRDQMRFILKLVRYYPGVLRRKPVKKGIYAFGKDADSSDEDVSEEA